LFFHIFLLVNFFVINFTQELGSVKKNTPITVII
jgi:hypothetical protein